jgi:hypothetical protein
MRNLNFGYLGAAALVAFVGCSSATKDADRVDQQQIYQRYSMSYDTDANRTSVTAQFREAGQEGETLRLPDKASVEHGSLELREGWDMGTRYVAEQAGFVKEHPFTFTDANGKTYTNTFTIPEAKLPNDLAARQPMGKAFTLAWEGEPIADDRDEVTLLVAPTGAAGVVERAQRVTVRTKGAKQIELSTQRLQELGEGRRELRLERIRRIPLQAGTDAGGYAEARYVSAPVAVEFFVDKAAPVDPKKAPPVDPKKDPQDPKDPQDDLLMDPALDATRPTDSPPTSPPATDDTQTTPGVDVPVAPGPQPVSPSVEPPQGSTPPAQQDPGEPDAPATTPAPAPDDIPAR